MSVLFDRFENNRGGRNRICKKSPRCDNFNDVFAFRFRADGFTNLHGCSHPEVYKEFSKGRLLGQPHG